MAAPPPVFSDLFNNPMKWDKPTPDYGALIQLLGGVASTAPYGAPPALFDRNQTMKKEGKYHKVGKCKKIGEHQKVGKCKKLGK